MLATFSAPVEKEAERLAIASCLETGVPLVVVNVVRATLTPRTLHLGELDPAREDYAAVRATAERAARLGISVEHLRVTSPWPPKAIVAIANERAGGGRGRGPERGRVSRWRLKRAAREARRNAACLIWIAGD